MIFLALLIGVTDPSCTKEKVCQDGYTATVRPPVRYTDALKAKQLQARHLTSSLSNFEEDHFMPLELCGCATCADNLWPQPWPEARKKDKDETRLHRSVCRGQLSLKQAQDQIRQLWKIH